jgi:RNA polymerase sigma-70 factor (ECF subfamily)
MTSSPLASEPADTAIPRLLDEHGGQIYGLGLRLCGSPEAAQDLVQETFLRAFRKWNQFEGRSSPSTWLYSIAARVCQRQHRLRSGEPRHMVPIGTVASDSEESTFDIPSSDETPLEALERKETRERVELAITALTPTFRLPLVLKDLMDLSISDVAEILGIKEATVKTRLHRARVMAAKEINRGTAQLPGPAEDPSKKMCLDLLRAKQDAMDRGVAFPIGKEVLCARCRSLFATFDLARDACRLLGEGKLPEPVKKALLEELKSPSPSSSLKGRGRKKLLK